jgi:energy-coupling factor transport system ATP-binding protein
VKENKMQINSSGLIIFDNVSFRYDSSKTILDGIKLSIVENEFTAIVGQNGCGKTTLLKNLCGLLRPQSGKIFIRGNDTGKMDITGIAEEIGIVMQETDNHLFEATVFDEITYPLKRKYSKNEIKEKAEEYLTLVGLLDKKDDFPLSLGRAGRVKTVFASILAAGARIIILDEPVAGLDYRNCRLLMGIANALRGRGYTVILVSHNMNIVAEYAQRVIVMKDAGVFMDGTPEIIFSQEEKLAEAGIRPPQIVRLSNRLKNTGCIEKIALTPQELTRLLKEQNW